MSVASFSQVKACRICGNSELTRVLELGDQALTGVFPSMRKEQITRGPLSLVKCHGKDSCGLLQLEHSYQPAEMYGENYGYRSGLNASMVRHLAARVMRICASERLKRGDLVVDIGSNDGTTLNSYSPDAGLRLIGIDPTGEKFRNYYLPHVELIPGFFNSSGLLAASTGQLARVITSFSMFYDLEAPLEFMRQVHTCLETGGLWVCEQSYMPAMLNHNAFDTICHEHIEYYALEQFAWMADRAGFCIESIEFNNVNGGSFCVYARKTDSANPVHAPIVHTALAIEEARGMKDLLTFRAFADRVAQCTIDLRAFLERFASEGRRIYGLGASTKGNVLLQHAEITEDILPLIGEINEEKLGRFTPGTGIPIVSEDEVVAREPEALLVLPWHFDDFFRRSTKFNSTSLVAPLPWLRNI